MAQTITNAIKLGKTPNAYLNTNGIRGVGKTTTARLIANFKLRKNFDSKFAQVKIFVQLVKKLIQIILIF